MQLNIYHGLWLVRPRGRSCGHSQFPRDNISRRHILNVSCLSSRRYDDTIQTVRCQVHGRLFVSNVEIYLLLVASGAAGQRGQSKGTIGVIQRICLCSRRKVSHLSSMAYRDQTGSSTGSGSVNTNVNSMQLLFTF